MNHYVQLAPVAPCADGHWRAIAIEESAGVRVTLAAATAAGQGLAINRLRRQFPPAAAWSVEMAA